MADKVTEALVEALKQALAEPGEQRLFRSGKLPGLFAGRSGANAEAATRAVQDGLLEVVRTDVKGKTSVEWARATPRGVAFLHDHESPVRALQELRDVLQAARDGVPRWLSEMRQQMQALETALTDNAGRWTQRLDVLAQRVEEALRRAEAGGGAQANGAVPVVPWAVDALAYLDRRQSSGAAGPCPLPELFAALREQAPELSVKAFHEGLRRLYDLRALDLSPFNGPTEELPEPEYALPYGAAVLYYAAR
jgi:hypothetical protein